MIARMVGLRLEGNAQAAHDDLEEAYGLLLGDRTDLIRKIDVSTAAKLLASSERIFLFAQLVREEAAQEPTEERRAALLERAVQLAGEAARRNPEDESIRRFLEEPGRRNP